MGARGVNRANTESITETGCQFLGKIETMLFLPKGTRQWERSCFLKYHGTICAIHLGQFPLGAKNDVSHCAPVIWTVAPGQPDMALVEFALQIGNRCQGPLLGSNRGRLLAASGRQNQQNGTNCTAPGPKISVCVNPAFGHLSYATLGSSLAAAFAACAFRACRMAARTLSRAVPPADSLREIICSNVRWEYISS